MLNSFAKSCLFGCMMALATAASAQGIHSGKKISVGKGVGYTAADSSYSIKFDLRVQPLAEAGWSLDGGSNEVESEALIRRGRLKFSGFAYDPRFTYKVELGFTNRDMESVGKSADFPGLTLDAYMNWNFYKNFSLQFGQFKLPGNRERVISSGALEFVDRSIVNSQFNLDRDIGAMLGHHFHMGNFQVREAIAFSHGEGRNRTTAEGGYSYTGRLELLPLGEFSHHGDYIEGDIYRESSPKLALGADANLNQDAMRAGGQLGSTLYEQRDIMTYHADMMFKFRGFSIFSEYALRDAEDPFTYNADSSKSIHVYTGRGFNAQAGYVFRNNVELAGRYSHTIPGDKVNAIENDRTDYTFGISKYFSGHALKLQTDVTYSHLELKDTESNSMMVRLSLNMEI